MGSITKQLETANFFVYHNYEAFNTIKTKNCPPTVFTKKHFTSNMEVGVCDTLEPASLSPRKLSQYFVKRQAYT